MRRLAEATSHVEKSCRLRLHGLDEIGKPFVQILSTGETPDTAYVVGTNRIDISAVHDPRTGNFVLTSAEDNLVKGASGQAVQIMNLWCGFDETAGLV